MAVGIVLTAVSGKAQLCAGNLGDAIINMNFGSGTPQTLGTASNYIFQTADCPDDGYYSIRSSSNNCFNTWHSISDHTGNGNMMLVNADFDPGVFYSDTVRNLCSQTTFEFSAWLINMLTPSACGGNGIKPDITFRIEKTDGSLLQMYNTGQLPALASPEWFKFGFYFTTPAGVNDVVLKMINNAPGGCGNDLAIDDISFRPCGPPITGNIVGAQGDTAIACNKQANNFMLSAGFVSYYQTPGYQWQAYMNGQWQDVEGATTLQYQVSFSAFSQPGSYRFRLAMAEAANISSPSCRVYANELTLIIQEAPLITATGDQTIFRGETATISATVTNGFADLRWLNTEYIADPNAATTTVNPVTDQSYIAETTSLNGCGTARDTVFIKVLQGLYIPNAFTPNGDNINDVWNIPGLLAAGAFRLEVYNRYGQLVFTTNNAFQGWNGKHKGAAAPSGSYIYLLRYRNQVKKGSLLLIR